MNSSPLGHLISFKTRAGGVRPLGNSPAASRALTPERQLYVRETIIALSQHFLWGLHSIAISGDTVHCVVTAADRTSPARIAREIKDWTRRLLAEDNLIEKGTLLWSDQTKSAPLWTFTAIEQTCRLLSQRDGFLFWDALEEPPT